METTTANPTKLGSIGRPLLFAKSPASDDLLDISAVDPNSATSSDNEGETKIPKRISVEQQATIIRMHEEERSRRQIAKVVGVGAKTVKRVLATFGVPQVSAKRGRKSMLTHKDEDSLVRFLLGLDKANLNWTWPLLHKLLELISRKKDFALHAAAPAGGRLFSSKWLVGFTRRHRKEIALRVVDYGLSVPMQNKQKTHPGRMETFEEIIRQLYRDINVADTHENILEVQDMWVNHIESPKTRKVFARKGRKNVRLTIGLPALDLGQKKRIRRPKPPATSFIAPQSNFSIPVQECRYQPPPVNETALRVALNAFVIAGYSEEDGRKILRDLNVPI